MSTDPTSKQTLISKYKALLDAATLSRDEAKILYNAARREVDEFNLLKGTTVESVSHRDKIKARRDSLARTFGEAELQLQRSRREYEEACAL